MIAALHAACAGAYAREGFTLIRSFTSPPICRAGSVAFLFFIHFTLPAIECALHWARSVLACPASVEGMSYSFTIVPLVISAVTELFVLSLPQGVHG